MVPRSPAPCTINRSALDSVAGSSDRAGVVDGNSTIGRCPAEPDEPGLPVPAVCRRHPPHRPTAVEAMEPASEPVAVLSETDPAAAGTAVPPSPPSSSGAVPAARCTLAACAVEPTEAPWLDERTRGSEIISTPTPCRPALRWHLGGEPVAPMPPCVRCRWR